VTTPPTPATAIIDGSLCRLNWNGTRAARQLPLATAVIEFLPGALCTFVRENPLGLLPGLSNVYCLDGDLNLRWLADWPHANDPCMALLHVENEVLSTLSTRGLLVRLDAATGRLVDAVLPVAAAS